MANANTTLTPSRALGNPGRRLYESTDGGSPVAMIPQLPALPSLIG